MFILSHSKPPGQKRPVLYYLSLETEPAGDMPCMAASLWRGCGGRQVQVLYTQFVYTCTAHEFA